MFNKDIYITGFLTGLVLNTVIAGLVWVFIEKVGISLISNPIKLYLLSAIPSILFMWYSMKKKRCMKIGIGTLLSVIVFVGIFFYYSIN